MAITKFRDEHFFLSNMYPLSHAILTPEGVAVSTSEQLYLAARIMQKTGRIAIERMPNGFAANNLFKQMVEQGLPVITDDEVRVELMREALRAKFAANPELAQKLRETGNEELVEGNRWGDQFWGVSPPPPEGVGQNWLGRILMEVREEVSNSEYDPQVGEIVLRLFACARGEALST